MNSKKYSLGIISLIIIMLLSINIFLNLVKEKEKNIDVNNVGAPENKTVTVTDKNGVKLTKTVDSKFKDKDGKPIINTKFRLESGMTVRTNIVIALDVSYSMVWPESSKYDSAISGVRRYYS